MRLRVLIAAALCCLVSFPSHSAETIAASLSAAPASADRLMARFGLPSVVPLIGRKDSDNSVLGILGLVLFVTSIAIRVTAVMSAGLV